MTYVSQTVQASRQSALCVCSRCAAFTPAELIRAEEVRPISEASESLARRSEDRHADRKGRQKEACDRNKENKESAATHKGRSNFF